MEHQRPATRVVAGWILAGTAFTVIYGSILNAVLPATNVRVIDCTHNGVCVPAPPLWRATAVDWLVFGACVGLAAGVVVVAANRLRGPAKPKTTLVWYSLVLIAIMWTGAQVLTVMHDQLAWPVGLFTGLVVGLLAYCAGPTPAQITVPWQPRAAGEQT